MNQRAQVNANAGMKDPADNNHLEVDGWDAWDQVALAQTGKNHPLEEVVVAHPRFPQDFVDVDHSSSSMRMMRALGTIIPLELVFALGSSNDEISLASDATSQFSKECAWIDRSLTGKIFQSYTSKDRPI